MNRTKLVIWIVVNIAAVLIIWRVGFYPPVPAQASQPVESNVAPDNPADANESVAAASDAGRSSVPSDVNEPAKVSDANEPQRPARPGGRGDAEKPAGRMADANDPNAPVALNLNNVEMKQVMRLLTEWTGKTVIPTEEAERARVSIYAPDKMPKSKALAHIYGALRLKGFIAEHTDGAIYITPAGNVKSSAFVPTLDVNQPLAALENKDQIVQKFFKLENYSPSQMVQYVQPFIGGYGHVSADETTGTLLVIDTVASLIRIEKIILELDVSQARQMKTEIFEIHHVSPEDVVRLLQTLLGDGSGSTGRGSGQSAGSRPPQTTGRSGSGSTATATSVTVGTSGAPITFIVEPKNNWIIVKAASLEDIERVREWITRLDKPVPTIPSDQHLAGIENKNQVVQYFFRLKSYNPTQMAQIVGPLLSANGYVSVDDSTRQLLVIDTVRNLIDIEKVIVQFDLPEAEQTVQDIFEIKNGDPSELVQLLRMLLDESGSASTRSITRSSSFSQTSRSSLSQLRPGSISSSSYSPGASRTGSGSMVMGPGQTPVVLIPWPDRKWIIARASAENMKRIEEWINKLDTQESIKKEYETISIIYGDVAEVASRLNEALTQMPGSDLVASVLIQPMEQSRKILVFGRQELREMVKTLIAEIDLPPGQFKTETIKLNYADPDQIKAKIDELYTQTSTGSSSRGYSYTFNYNYNYGASRSSTSSDMVKVISYITLKQVTVIASPENIEKIRKQIEEWDVPLNINEVKPRIIELKNSDPIQMATLLRTLFSEESSGSSRASIYEILYGISSTTGQQKIVGPLYGQLTFQDVPGTKKIIVISKIPEAYDVIEQLVRDLDREEMAEVPKVVQLKYANPEDLAERLNALFNETGTTAAISRTLQGLSPYSYSMETGSTGTTESTGTETTEFRPWWNTGRTTTDQTPISNVIGRIRFVPDVHTKSILVLSPPEFMDSIEALIHELDKAGKQVMIRAIVLEVDHSKVTSLGVELATNSAAFGTLEENSVVALTNLTNLGRFGTDTGSELTRSTISTAASQGSGTLLGIGTDVYALVDFLVRKTNAKILNQQTVWTKDNEEAIFFKGQRVPFSTSSTNILTGAAATTQNFSFEKVGMTLRGRPSITPEQDVDMIVNVVLTQLTTAEKLQQPIRNEMETTTNMIIKNGQTIMLGGILSQEDQTVQRKLPILGDLPLIGGLFGHNKTIISNSEMIVFITPYVVDELTKTLPEAQQELDNKKSVLKDIEKQLKSKLESMTKSQDPAADTAGKTE